MDQLTIAEIAFIPVISGVIQAFKIAFGDQFSKIAPITSLLFGITLNVGMNGISAESAIIGIVYGLAASGLYAQIKSTNKDFINRS